MNVVRVFCEDECGESICKKKRMRMPLVIRIREGLWNRP